MARRKKKPTGKTIPGFRQCPDCSARGCHNCNQKGIVEVLQ